MSDNKLSLPRVKSTLFVDYIPAELRQHKDWLIVYYAKNPATGQLERERARVPKLKSMTERLKLAKKMVIEVNRKLADGWHPALEHNGRNSFRPYRECCDKFIELTEKEVRDGIKSEDTLRTYRSFLSMIDSFLTEKKRKLTFALEFNKPFIVDYLQWIYYDRDNSPRTYNNHLLFITTFCNYLIEKSYIKENPTNEITKKKLVKKKRSIFSKRVKEIIRDNLPAYNWNYFVLCMVSYYSMVRRTELTKLKVKDFDLSKGIVIIPCGEGKYKGQTETATLPVKLQTLLYRHFLDANAADFAFSKNNFMPGPQKLTPKKITDVWTIFREKFGLQEYQWYDLKRTGITDLFLLNIPSLTIRDQARHKDLKTTELYTPYIKPGNEEIMNSGASF